MINTLKIKKFILRILGKNSNGKLSFVLSYIHNRYKMPNLSSPKDLSEILIKRVLDGEVDKIYYLADKYKVREYIHERGYEKYLPSLIGVYNIADEIPFENLPQRFALKLNYGAGMNIICTDKKILDFEEVKTKLNSWINRNIIYSYAERHYNLIERKIICEEFVDDGSGEFPADYKFMCVKGTPLSVLVCVDRGKETELHYPFDMNWNPQPHYIKTKRKLTISCPENFSEMKQIAMNMAKGLDFVRIDLYSNGKQIWIGELTLTPAGCILHNWTQKALDDMGLYYRKH